MDHVIYFYGKSQKSHLYIKNGFIYVEESYIDGDWYCALCGYYIDQNVESPIQIYTNYNSVTNRWYTKNVCCEECEQYYYFIEENKGKKER